MASNNYYYKLIYELLYGEEVEETHNDLWYLKRIAYYYQYTEEAIRCKGKYLKEIAHAITGETYNSSHSNNYYLRKIANSLSGETTRWLTENYYLKIISQYIGNDKTPTVLTLDTPMLIYTDVFDVTGTLTDDEDNPISNATITLEWTVNGNTQSTTATTDSNGEVTFHNSKVTTVNQYSFKLKYSGSNEYNRATSSVVNVTPLSESGVINVTKPASGGSSYNDGGVVVTGTFMTNDDEPIGNEEILVKENDTTVKTITTNNNGTFNSTITGLADGSHTLTFHYVGSSEYSETTLDRTFTVTQPTLTSDKSILSFADTDSCIITAHYNNSGKTVKLYDYSDDSEIGTMTDNGDGTYSYEYDSEGVGDRTFYAKYSTFLTKTYEVEDCLDYQELTSNAKQSRWTIPSAVSSSSIFGYSDNGWKYGNASSFSNITYYQTLNYPFSIEIGLTDFSSSSPSPIGVSIGSSYILMYPKNSTTVTFYVGGNTQDYTVSSQMPKTLRIDVTDSTAELYIDDTLIATKNHSLTGIITPLLQTGTSRMVQIKDFKIKPL